MSDAAGSGLGAIVAFATSLVGVLCVERYANRLGLVDLPNIRSSHIRPRPRGGGLGIIAGVFLGAAAAAAVGVEVDRSTRTVLVASALVALVGLWDDIRRLGIASRLVVQTIAASAVTLVVGGIDRLPLPAPLDVSLGWAGPVVSIVWLVGITNFFNFMDGLDGLASGQALITLATFAVVVWPGSAACVAVFGAAATTAFLLRNWSPARVFLGDVGSSFLGFLMASLPLASAAPRTNSALVLLVATTLALFLLDPVATLFLRARQGARLGASHRQHAYQQFVAVGTSHGPVVASLLFVALGLSFVAVAGYWHDAMAWPAVILATIAFAIEWSLAARRRPPSA